jgi:mevalonate kinase
MAINTNGASNGLGEISLNGSNNDVRAKLKRKASSPMMPAFMVSAPGKVIVFGEHSVVHGKVSEPDLDPVDNR